MLPIVAALLCCECGWEGGRLFFAEKRRFCADLCSPASICVEHAGVHPGRAKFEAAGRQALEHDVVSHAAAPDYTARYRCLPHGLHPCAQACSRPGRLASTLCWSPSKPREKIEGTPPELRQGLFTSSPGTPSPDSKSWSAFPESEEPKPQVAVKNAHPRSVRTLRASNSTKASSLGQSKVRIGADPFAFGEDNFKADLSGTVLPKISNLGNTSQPLDNLNAEESEDSSYQPAGWTGF